MCYLLNALSCTDWHIWKKLQKYIFMFTRLKVVPTIKIGTHTGPLCHVKNVTFWKFSWYCEKTRWKALYFYMINMICMMCVFIWLFTQLHFYLIDDSFVGQKYGIEFSCQFRCRNMSCETRSKLDLPFFQVSLHCNIFTWHIITSYRLIVNDPNAHRNRIPGTWCYSRRNHRSEPEWTNLSMYHRIEFKFFIVSTSRHPGVGVGVGVGATLSGW